MTMEMGTSGLMDFVQRYQALRAHQDSNDELIKDLLLYCRQIESGLREENQLLRQQLGDASLDLADATRSRRDMQQRVGQLEAENEAAVKGIERLKNYNPYVVILLDGDGILFKESFVGKGIEGGKQAAYALRTAVLRECGEYAADVTVIAKYVANLGGLAKAMRRDGSLEREDGLKDFTLGFSKAMASFDFVDIGAGKERTDTKIKEALRWNLQNFNCKHIFLGISHDSGYASFLDEILRDEPTRRRVSILEGSPTVHELRSTGLEVLNYTGTLFRAEKLVDKTTQRYPTPPPATSPAATSPVSAPATAAPPPSYSAAVVCNGSPPPQITMPIPPKSVSTTGQLQQQARPRPPAAWHPRPRGLDAPLHVNQTVLEAIKKLKDSSKLCNNHYLRGSCTKGDSCGFEHRHKASPEERVCVAFMARLSPCTNGQDCELEDCIYGHHCPSTSNGLCSHPYCKFKPWEHPPGTKFRPTYPWLDEI